MSYYLGIDGGGTKTACAVGDESRILATAISGPSNIVRVGRERSRESLQASVRDACDKANVKPSQIRSTCAGGSGAGRPEVAEIVRSLLAEVLPSPIAVVGDMEIALEGAFDGGAGVIVIAGTGSIAYGRDRQGKTSRAGGWGFALSDEGSAHWIGRMAVSELLRAADYAAASSEARQSFEKSPLLSALMKDWKVTSLLDLARTANAIPPPDFALLFRSVAATNDPLALRVLSRAGQELAQIAAIVLSNLFPAERKESVPVAMTGGVFRHSQQVRNGFYNELLRLDGRVEINPVLIEPVEGALRLARKATGSSR